MQSIYSTSNYIKKEIRYNVQAIGAQKNSHKKKPNVMIK